MEIHGSNLIGRSESREGFSTLIACNPATGATIDPPFLEATMAEIDRAARLADTAFGAYAETSAAERAAFLRAIGSAIMGSGGDALIERAHAETALPHQRLVSERARTINQLRMFADLVEEGSWVDARIDRRQPDRQPAPRPDIRRTLTALGPVAVFGSSNFPLAFSVAGGDTASALAAGCPVVVKAHPGHPGTSEIVARAILEAAASCSMPDGVFSMLQGATHAIGRALVLHPSIAAAGFTGSLAGGRALFDAAAARPCPIPVYAEMGSCNPVFLLPAALERRAEEIARGLAASATLAAGQFCTNPGLVFVERSPAAGRFTQALVAAIQPAPAGTMVLPSISKAFESDLDLVSRLDGVSITARSQASGPRRETEARPAVLAADAGAYMRHARLAHEIYGPATVVVTCESAVEIIEIARSLHGHLTATVHADDADIARGAELLAILKRKAGRLVVNAFPTGVEVCPAMHHGGPYPATTDSRSTSVGTAAILRFARPVCYQDAPESWLPEELRDSNPRGILRLIDGVPTRDPL